MLLIEETMQNNSSRKQHKEALESNAECNGDAFTTVVAINAKEALVLFEKERIIKTRLIIKLQVGN